MDSTRVYPRPRGGTQARSICTESRSGLSPPTRGTYRVQWRTDAQSGLSPPTRGNLCGCGRRWTRLGSIPAHAGEPKPGRYAPSRAAVYPRPRGGTYRVQWRTDAQSGLSPPTRGNLCGCGRRWTRLGSIPAHAGEPKPGRYAPSRAAVYPRPRGGTYRVQWRTDAQSGLSPPTRGNLGNKVEVLVVVGSIPAHAGEP